MANFSKDLLNVGHTKFFSIFFGLLTSVIIARVLGVEKTGVIASILVYPNLFMSIGSLGIRQSTTYFIGKKIFPEDDIKTSIVNIWFISSIVSLIACFLLIWFFNDFGEEENRVWLITLAVIAIPFSLFNTYKSGIFLGKNQISSFNRISLIPPLVILLLTFFLVYIFSLGVVGYFLALIVGPLFVFIKLFIKNDFINHITFQVNWGIVNKMLRLGIVYAVALLIINLNYKLDIILLDYLSTDYEVGIYVKGGTLAQYLWQIPTLLSAIVFARSAISKDDTAFSVKVAQLLRISFTVISIAAIFLFLTSEFIITGLFGIEFLGSVKVLKILLIGVVLLTVFKVMNMDLAGKGKPWVSLKAMMPALLLNIVLNIILIPEYGANGAAFSSALSYSLAAILFLFFYCKEVKLSLMDVITPRKSDYSKIIEIVKKTIK